KLLWKKSLGTGRLVKNNKSGAPMIYKDKVYLGSPMTKTFYAFDLKTGKKVWEFENERIKAPPVAKNGVVYFSNAEGLVYALDTESGKEVGKVALDGVLATSGPTIINDTLFIGSQNTKVYAVSLMEFYRDKKID
ncbi:MAG: PQQ-binding-like beta-propeller repeat protein, partial [Pisciglobus halotolerans]|nr:PQQ-binding-like beta-propeller repeat protein [Pisciglobus halotolerans]